MVGKTNYIVVTGGVLSGLGKGTVTSSLGKLLQAQGYQVTSIKIDPYINVDAGTMRPTEHGEVFVTEDGGETDQDLGNYERFLDVAMMKENNITTGQVYLSVIQRERNLEYGGKCVEVIPHIPQEVKLRIMKVAKDANADFVLIEVGGTIGDYQNILFLEALREMKMSKEKVAFVHVSYLPIPGNIGEMKTKPTQHSVRALNSVGIQPDFLVCRGTQPVDDVRKKKLAMFCNIEPDNVISSPDAGTIYEVPLIFQSQGFCRNLMKMFNVPYDEGKLESWKAFVDKIKSCRQEAKIGIIGKYFDIGDFTLEDSYVSVIESVKHAAWAVGLKPHIEWIDSKDFEKDRSRLKNLDNLHGVIVPGGFGGSGVEGKISAIQYCRENMIPYLGLCYGMQLAVVEFARHVCGMEGANTTEIDPSTRYPVIDILPEQKELIAKSQYGATMRLGAYPAKLKQGTKVHLLYGQDQVSERHRHRYEVNPEFIKKLENAGMLFSGASPDRRLMEFMELPTHPYFVGTQSHPEFKSRPTRPAPLFHGLLKAAKERLKP
ncbi:CTP synthase [Candidatus Woesearchaeota archaeon]|nr:CTP synthase [Candidatus Woesearchaeota archaeon]